MQNSDSLVLTIFEFHVDSLQNIVAALRAGAEYAEVPIDKCILVAGGQPGASAAERIGMPSVVLRSR